MPTPMPMAEMKFARVPLDQLHVSAQNVRKAAPDPDKLRELAASIAAEGLVEPLVVSAGKDGTAVIAGGRRLLAMQQLAAAGKWEPHTPVGCVVISNGASAGARRNLEISLAENTGREELHPVDQAEAFRALRDEGATDKQLAAKFGVSGRTVQRRLRTAQAAPELRKKCRDGEISLGVLEAVCIEPDHDRQIAAAAAVGAQARHNHAADDVTRWLKKESVSASSQLGKFVGLERYRAAGGPVSEDLESGGAATRAARYYMDDKALVQRLMQERMREAAEKEVAVNGWPAGQVKCAEELPWNYWSSWDESPATKFSSLPKRAREGAVLHLGMAHGGDIARLVLVKRGTLSAEAPTSPIGEDPAPADQATKIPHSLVVELQAMRLSVLRRVLSEAPAEFARDLLTFALARKVYGKARHPVLGLAVSATPHPNLLDSFTPDRLPYCVRRSDAALTEREEGLLEWIGGESDAADGQLDLEWARFRALTGLEREQLLTCCVARMLTPSRPAGNWADRAIHAELPISWPALFDPSTAILSRLTKAQLLEIARRDFPADVLDLRGLAGLKKAELVQRLVAASAEHRSATGNSPWLPREVFGD